MRAAELLSLQFSHVHETSSMNYVEFKGKREKWRRIPLSQKSIHLINRLKNLMQIEGVLNPYIAFNIHNVSTAISYENLRLITVSAALKSTDDKLSPHWFRRSFITKMLHEGYSLYSVMDIAGHENINTTNNYLQILKSVNLPQSPFE